MRLALIDDAEDLDGDERRERHEGDAPEGERHDRTRSPDRAARADRHGKYEGRDHRTARNAARVKTDTREHGRREEGEPQCDDIPRDKEIHDVDIQKDAQHGKPDGAAHADAQPLLHRRRTDGARGDPFHLFVEDVHGGLCRNNEIPDDHPDGDEQPAPPKGSERPPDLAADGHEADVCTR